jgi:6-phosphofructokinase 2
MRPILTLTLNPSIDGSAETDVVRPIRKIRTSNERYEPGGGGINVARVVRELGGITYALYLAGGATGSVLADLLSSAGIAHRSIAIEDHTRISHAFYERSSGLEYRFVPEGPLVREAEWQACLTALASLDCDYLVASGSLPRGVPTATYARVAEIAAKKRMKLVLDTSGEGLRSALDHGGIHLIKPSLGELEALIGSTLSSPAAQEAAARRLVESGAVEIITVTLGRDGALLVTQCELQRLEAPKVPVKSAVGAGDSFLGAMTLGLAQGRAIEDAFAYAVAAGTAAVLSSGTGLCRREDVEWLYGELKGGSRADDAD